MGLQIENQLGKSIIANGDRVYPVTRVVRWVSPWGSQGGLVWNMPFQVIVRRSTGEEIILPVRDVTRQAVIFLAITGIIAPIAIAIFLSINKRKVHNGRNQKTI